MNDSEIKKLQFIVDELLKQANNDYEQAGLNNDFTLKNMYLIKASIRYEIASKLYLDFILVNSTNS